MNHIRFKIKFLATLLILLPLRFVSAESGWIKDKTTGCIFFNKNPESNETIKFEGRCNKLAADGKLIWYSDGELNEVQTGKWVKGKLTGYGTYNSIKTGNFYEGQFIDGDRSGKGMSKSANGDVYEGQFVKDKREGKGVYKWANGAVYEGEFIEGKRTGKGTMKWPNGNIYSGDFLDGKLNGNGVFKWPNGNTYTGNFLNGKFSGKGTESFAKGGKYVGDFLDGKFHGKGTLYLEDNGQTIHTGEFVFGKLSGPSLVSFPDGTRLEVNMEDGKFQGFGRVIFPDGKIMTGKWTNSEFVPDYSKHEHETCADFGYRVGSPDYATCRKQIELARQQIDEEKRAYRQQLQEMQNRMEEERRDAAIWRGLNALNIATGLIRPPPIQPTTPTSSEHVYNLPGGRTMTCSNLGYVTNCN